jgi:hypothetical protein
MDDEKFFSQVESIKNLPDYMQYPMLIILCKTDETGHAERMVRILAEYGVPTEKVLSCYLDIMRETVKTGAMLSARKKHLTE